MPYAQMPLPRPNVTVVATWAGPYEHEYSAYLGFFKKIGDKIGGEWVVTTLYDSIPILADQSATVEAGYQVKPGIRSSRGSQIMPDTLWLLAPFRHSPDLYVFTVKPAVWYTASRGEWSICFDFQGLTRPQLDALALHTLSGVLVFDEFVGKQVYFRLVKPSYTAPTLSTA